jgi:predicted AlkP superfamily pyrophosphatase or phosphodiesterase
MKKNLVIQTAALSWELWQKYKKEFANLTLLSEKGTAISVTPPLPAVTVTAQASFTTGTLPEKHGMVSNGFFDRNLMKTSFWEQSDKLVQGEKIWQAISEKTAMLFWQNSIGSRNDIILSPAPIHKHGGGIINTCYSKPDNLYDELTKIYGEFKLRWYWGPFTSIKATDWIAKATAHVIKTYNPTLALTYLPHLDYVLQKYGAPYACTKSHLLNPMGATSALPADNHSRGIPNVADGPQYPKIKKEIKALDDVLGNLIKEAEKIDYDITVFSDYAITPVNEAVFINRILKDNQLLSVRNIKGKEYLDYGSSSAFALVDHQIAHIYCLHNQNLKEKISKILSEYKDDFHILSDEKKISNGLNHQRSGELIAVANEGKWFAYPWWTETKSAPDFATHVDIHNKPGFDPLELFFDWRHLGISQDTTKIKGSHGRTGNDKSLKTLLVTNKKIPLKEINLHNIAKSAISCKP